MAALVRAEIVVSGLVQGVGFRYFVQRRVNEIGGITGYVKNLYNGDVMTVAEGRKDVLEHLFEAQKTGPRSAMVQRAVIDWREATNEFITFEVRY